MKHLKSISKAGMKKKEPFIITTLAMAKVKGVYTTMPRMLKMLTTGVLSAHSSVICQVDDFPMMDSLFN